MIDKILIWDIETYDELFLVVVYIPGDRTYRWEISRWKNEVYSFIKFIEQHKDYYWVGFNSLSFDSQVVEWVLRNYETWVDKTGFEIAGMIAQKAKDRIDDANYDIFPKYRETSLSFKHIDLFTIWMFGNKNRRTSLKALEFYMCVEDIEETPIPFTKKNITIEDRASIIRYCENDVRATYKFYLITIGETDISIYKGENKIADRVIMMEEFELPCLNWDDVKIGAEWNKKDYIALTKKPESELKPERIMRFYGKKFKQFFPKTVKFQTPELNKFVREFGNMFALNKKQEFKYKFNNELTATVAKGGIHSNETGRFIKPSSQETYYQIDIGSQYPNAIRKYKVEPRHLPGWNNLIVSKIDRRLSYKKQYQETKIPKYNSMQKMGKLALNGGSYGRLNTKGDWQEYPYGMLQVTIGGQLEILMVVEDLLLKGFRVISLNTDGFDCIIPKNRDEEFRNILTQWEMVIGNDVLGQFEYTEFQWIAQTSVNDYLALKKDGTTKQKGDFEIDKECNKNNSMRIVPIALKERFVNNTPIEETIKNHKNIYDFALRQKSSSNFHYEGINLHTNEKTIYNKLIRYYVSNTGEKILKIKNPECTTNAAPVSQIHAGEWLCHVCNKLKANHPLNNVNFNFYIDKANRIVDKIRYGGKKIPKKDINQLSLW